MLAVVLAAGCLRPAVRPSPVARLDGRLWRDARRADALGLTPTASLSSGPGRSGDLVQPFAEAPDLGGGPVELEPRASEDRRPPAAGRQPNSWEAAWLGALREEHRGEMEDALADGASSGTYLEPFESPQLRYVFIDGSFDFYNEQGRQFHKGSNVYLSNRAVARLGEQVLLSVEPELGYVENRNSRLDDKDLTLGFQELAASARVGPSELTVGRMPLWWGPGRHGALLVSNNARPFDMVRVSSAGPQLLPGFLGWLGLVQGQLFVTQLERERPVEKPILAGLRVSTRLNPYIELGASRTAMLGGKGRKVTLGTIGDVVLGNTENEPDDPGNQLASVDARLIVPFRLQPFEVYGELGGEDEAGGLFSKRAYLVGLYLPKLGPWDSVECTVELADTKVPGDARVWYTNVNYPAGYTYFEEVIGHHVGTDGLDIFAEVRVHVCEDVSVAVSYDYEEHLRQDPVREVSQQARLAVEGRVLRRLWLGGFAGLQRWRNFRQEEGRSETGLAVGFAARWEF